MRGKTFQPLFVIEIEKLLLHRRKHKKEDADAHCCTNIFFEQWNALKDAATEKGITLVGDLPIFVSSNGVDTWVNRHLFHLDEMDTPIQ